MGYIQIDVMEPLKPSGSAIGGLWNSPKLPQIAINEAYGAMKSLTGKNNLSTLAGKGWLG